MQTSDRELYWILSGHVPTGPFDAAEIQTKLAASEITTAAKACRVGGDEWVPIEKLFSGPADVAVDAQSEPISRAAIESPTTRVSDSAPIKTSPPVTFTYRKETRIAAAVLAVFTVIWLISWWLTPLTPRQVAERFVAAETADEMLKYTTLNLHPAIRALPIPDEADDPADRFELTQDRPAPADVGGHYVGCRLQFRDTESKQWVQLDGVFHLIETDGWKIEDFYINGVNNEALETPISMARDFRNVLASQPPKAKPPGQHGKRPQGGIIAEGLFGKRFVNWMKSGLGQLTFVSLAILVLGYDYYKRRTTGAGFL